MATACLIAFFFVGGWLVPIDPSFFQSSTSVLILLLTTDWLDPFFSGIIFLPSAESMERAFPRRWKSLFCRSRLHAPDDIADVVRDEQRACPIHGHAFG